MRRAAVTSTCLASVGYDAPARTLEVEFLTGAVYRYFDVPPAEHDALMNAPSKGRYLNHAIKGRYRYRRMD